MPKSNPDSEQQTKQSFVSQADRPEVKITLDTPVSELRVRELGSILNYMISKDPNFEVGKTGLKDFFDKPFPEVAKDWLKEIKRELLEKPGKWEKNEKLEKNEKREKIEIKELKLEKNERGEVVYEPNLPPEGDPGLQQVIQVVAGLTRQVSQLANQVEELRRKIENK